MRTETETKNTGPAYAGLDYNMVATTHKQAAVRIGQKKHLWRVMYTAAVGFRQSLYFAAPSASYCAALQCFQVMVPDAVNVHVIESKGMIDVFDMTGVENVNGN
jgi:hypothetical protein